MFRNCRLVLRTLHLIGSASEEDHSLNAENSNYPAGEAGEGETGGGRHSRPSSASPPLLLMPQKIAKDPCTVDVSIQGSDPEIGGGGKKFEINGSNSTVSTVSNGGGQLLKEEEGEDSTAAQLLISKPKKTARFDLSPAEIKTQGSCCAEEEEPAVHSCALASAVVDGSNNKSSVGSCGSLCQEEIPAATIEENRTVLETSF